MEEERGEQNNVTTPKGSVCTCLSDLSEFYFFENRTHVQIQLIIHDTKHCNTEVTVLMIC